MSKSIMSNERECYVCKTPCNLHKHHVYGGSGRREISEKQGCWVYLCAFHHNMSNYGVHFDKQLDLRLKKECQEKWMQANRKTKQDFIDTFHGMSYL